MTLGAGVVINSDTFLPQVSDRNFSCYDLASSPLMIENKTENIIVKNCDHGPLTFVVERNLKLDWSNDWSKYVRENNKK